MKLWVFLWGIWSQNTQILFSEIIFLVFRLDLWLCKSVRSIMNAPSWIHLLFPRIVTSWSERDSVRSHFIKIFQQNSRITTDLPTVSLLAHGFDPPDLRMLWNSKIILRTHWWRGYLWSRAWCTRSTTEWTPRGTVPSHTSRARKFKMSLNNLKTVSELFCQLNTHRFWHAPGTSEASCVSMVAYTIRNPDLKEFSLGDECVDHTT